MTIMEAKEALENLAANMVLDRTVVKTHTTANSHIIPELSEAKAKINTLMTDTQTSHVKISKLDNFMVWRR